MEGKSPPAQVAEGQGDLAPASIGMQWGTTMSAGTMLVLVKRHKLEQDAATGMELAYLLLHPACQSMMVPGLPDLKQLVLVVL